jgi:hypothetical protein
MNIPKPHNKTLVCKKRPFAMAEVCVAVAVVGLATTYIFSSMQESITRYTRLRDAICCNELADEHLARTIARFLTDPPDFDTATAENALPSSMEVGPYTVSLETGCEQEKDKKENDASTTEKKPVALLELTVTASRTGADGEAQRSALLCICKEGM